MMRGNSKNKMCLLSGELLCKGDSLSVILAELAGSRCFRPRVAGSQWDAWVCDVCRLEREAWDLPPTRL